jgi:hypothetical protein
MTNDNFRESIELNFGDLNVKDKEHLKALMRHRRYFNVIQKYDETTEHFHSRANRHEQVILDDAWRHLQSIKESPMMTARGREGITVNDVGRKSLIVRDCKTGRIIKWLKRE